LHLAGFPVIGNTEPFSSAMQDVKMEAVKATNDNVESAKRQQILDGARRCFLAMGFDAASMNDIVKEAGVSKGTVYAYFPSKEKLFEAMVYVDRRRAAEQLVVIEREERPIEAVLTELGLRMAQQFTTDEQIAYSRMVMSVAGRFPAVGHRFFEAGPAYAIARIGEYFQRKIDDGTLRRVDSELAAMQFIELVQCGLFKPRLFSATDLFKHRSVEEVVDAGVQLFLRGMQS
jgi:AcrR family transcriptional regulator